MSDELDDKEFYRRLEKRGAPKYGYTHLTDTRKHKNKVLTSDLVGTKCSQLRIIQKDGHTLALVKEIALALEMDKDGSEAEIKKYCAGLVVKRRDPALPLGAPNDFSKPDPNKAKLLEAAQKLKPVEYITGKNYIPIHKDVLEGYDIVSMRSKRDKSKWMGQIKLGETSIWASTKNYDTWEEAWQNVITQGVKEAL